ncbi:hypothetical protein G4B88_030792 [Cannabis sativa]|uniref:SMARCC C-terminal domain-containing protein n=1 Tax=Cannabis sativa TaxID=3483 RepID=A0A7J6H9M3_CANSA|nr:hypothetical protein G4B88_030792 [Cannabis sativa]
MTISASRVTKTIITPTWQLLERIFEQGVLIDSLGSREFVRGVILERGWVTSNQSPSTLSDRFVSKVRKPSPIAVQDTSRLKRLELKLKQFAQVETLLINECEQVERARERLLAQRSHCMASWMGARRVPFSLSLPATAGSSLTNDTGDSRQQTMLAPPSQPSISGYNNQPQQVHPHMPFMLQQQMFALGPRLPLAAIQSPSTALPNVMYNSSGNSQPNTSFGFAEK